MNDFRLAGVMGWPVGHSLSPLLHGSWIAEHGIRGAYVPLRVPPDGVLAAVRGLPALGFAGANVTLPHKQAVIPALDRIEPFAARVGAVNTILCRADGTLEGRNTDGPGFIAALKDAGWKAAAGPATVLGAGGAARGMVAALLDEGVSEIRLVNRGLERAHALAEEIGGPIRPVAWSDRMAALDGTQLLANATTLGMRGKPALEIGLDPLPPHALVFDAVYVPLETPLLAAARARGNPVADGLSMLMHQAVPGFAAWFGVTPRITPALRQTLVEALPR